MTISEQVTTSKLESALEQVTTSELESALEQVTTSKLELALEQVTTSELESALERYASALNDIEKTKPDLLNDNNPSLTNPITPAIAKALQYSQELIEDYKKTRSTSRNIYYIFQISTIVLSGVTPILVLVERFESGPLWLKWLPVICPALAAIVASIVTSFPFQENWIAANTAVELLEAEQENFILGVTQPYR